VKSASVTVDEKLVSSIGRGLLVLAGVGKEDTEKDADTLIQRILKAKLWPAEEGGEVSSLYPGKGVPEANYAFPFSGKGTCKTLRGRCSVVGLAV
jgi:hypothetical protein